MSLHVRMRYRVAGGHVNVRVFTGPDADHLALTGELNERVEEWIGFRRALATVDFVCDDDDETRAGYDWMVGGVLVTTMDLDANAGETLQLPPDGYVLTVGKGMELTGEQHYGNGTTQLTIRPRPAEQAA